jgi:hypothetical protein
VSGTLAPCACPVLRSDQDASRLGVRSCGQSTRAGGAAECGAASERIGSQSRNAARYQEAKSWQESHALPDPEGSGQSMAPRFDKMTPLMKESGGRRKERKPARRTECRPGGPYGALEKLDAVAKNSNRGRGAPRDASSRRLPPSTLPAHLPQGASPSRASPSQHGYRPAVGRYAPDRSQSHRLAPQRKGVRLDPNPDPHGG